MGIKKKIIEKIISIFERDNYVNIFVIGQEGNGKTTFALQLINKICKKLEIKSVLDMMNYNLEDFCNCERKVRFFCEGNPFNKKKKLSKNEIKKEFKQKINIIESQEEPNNFPLPYFLTTIYEKGKYDFDALKGTFSDMASLKKKELAKKLKKEIDKEFNKEPRSEKEIYHLIKEYESNNGSICGTRTLVKFIQWYDKWGRK